MGRALLALDPRQAEEVRRRRRAGETWRSIADAFGWSCSHPAQYIKNALRRRAPNPAAVGGYLSRAEATRLAEADPSLSRRCAKCGRPNHKIVSSGGDGYDAVPVGFVRRGGRWLCEECAPKPKPPTDFQGDWGESADTYTIQGLRARP